LTENDPLAQALAAADDAARDAWLQDSPFYGFEVYVTIGVMTAERWFEQHPEVGGEEFYALLRSRVEQATDALCFLCLIEGDIFHVEAKINQHVPVPETAQFAVEPALDTLRARAADALADLF